MYIYIKLVNNSMYSLLGKIRIQNKILYIHRLIYGTLGSEGNYILFISIIYICWNIKEKKINSYKLYFRFSNLITFYN